MGIIFIITLLRRLLSLQFQQTGVDKGIIVLAVHFSLMVTDSPEIKWPTASVYNINLLKMTRNTNLKYTASSSFSWSFRCYKINLSPQMYSHVYSVKNTLNSLITIKYIVHASFWSVHVDCCRPEHGFSISPVGK